MGGSAWVVDRTVPRSRGVDVVAVVGVAGLAAVDSRTAGGGAEVIDPVVDGGAEGSISEKFTDDCGPAGQTEAAQVGGTSVGAEHTALALPSVHRQTQSALAEPIEAATNKLTRRIRIAGSQVSPA